MLQNTDNLSEAIRDIEDIGGKGQALALRPVVHSNKRQRSPSPADSQIIASTWREALGPPPPFGSTKVLRIYYNIK